MKTLKQIKNKILKLEELHSIRIVAEIHTNCILFKSFNTGKTKLNYLTGNELRNGRNGRNTN